MYTFMRHSKILHNGHTCWRYSKDGSRKYTTPQYLLSYARRPHVGVSSSPCFRTGVSVPIGLQPILLSRCNTISVSSHHRNIHDRYFSVRYGMTRKFHLSRRLDENASSKVEVTVKTMKEKQKEKVEEIIKEASAPSKAPENVDDAKAVTTKQQKAVVVKKALRTRIWEEVLHYYHGFRLLFIDINISIRLLVRVLRGKTLTRRENNLLLRTTSDLFRLIPFSVFIIVPFMELLLPFFIRFFPGMLPSTFLTKKDREDKLKQSLQVRLEMAKFLQRTLDEMAVQHKDHKSEDAKQFAEFFQKIKDPKGHVPVEEIIKFAKRFEDEITLDALSREQLAALCRVLEINTMGTTNLLRFQLRVKLRSLSADDRVIAREGVDALDLFELQQACKARGMRAYGLTSDKLRSQLQEWIDLSLNEKVPQTLLLLSRALLVSDDTTLTTQKLMETMRVLPDSVATKTKEKIGESEGKIDNKTKIEVLKEEERKIKEEREEEREAEKAKLEEQKAKETDELLDHAPLIHSDLMHSGAQNTPSTQSSNITPKDVELLSSALKSLSTDKKMVVEKEAIKELKEELADYKEDVEELHEVRNVVNEPVHESRAAKMLFKRINRMVKKLDVVLVELEKKRQVQQKKAPEGSGADVSQEDIVRIDELMNAIRKVKTATDSTSLKQIENVLSKIDSDKDGVITVDEVMKIMDAISRENVQLTDKQIEELVTLLDKENAIETEERLEKAIAKSIRLAAKQIKERQKERALSDLKDFAEQLKDKATDLSSDSQKNVIKTETSKEKNPLLEAAEKQKEKILPTKDISTQMPQQLPSTPPPNTTPQVNPKDKML